MSTAKSIKPRSHLIRMLEKLGIISKEEAKKVEQEKENNPFDETSDILMNHGVSKADIELAEATDTDDIDCPAPIPINGEMVEETTGKQLVHKRQEVQDKMGETITTGIRLADVAAAIAKK